ncbi:hypothetical protein BGX27_000755 [Mortierella sp. AM989]|nr:hypothetical protein BGX27_000755 [Mortierella sp. AM989]
MAGSMDSPSSSRGAYTSLNHDRIQASVQEAQSFPLQDHSKHNSNGDDSGSESDKEEHNNRDFRVAMSNQDDEDDDDEDDDSNLEYMSDIAPLAASSKRYQQVKPSYGSSTRVSNPCKVFGAIFGSAIIIALVFAILSLLHPNRNTGLEQEQNNNSQNETQPDNRILKPPIGISVDDFKLSDFQLPPWDWDINSFLPINITNGPKFTQIQWRNGEQYLQVNCPQPNYRYHLLSFPKDEFREHPSTVDLTSHTEKLLHLGEEPYVFVLCPPGKNNANVVFRELDAPDEEAPDAPPHVEGTVEAPQPLLDDVVMLLVDAISRAKFLAEMKTVMETLTKINTTSTDNGVTGHRIFDFEHYNVLGQNSPPNKAFIYSGQSIENMNHGPKHWLWDVYEEQGFSTAHTDGECGGEKGIHDYITGAITYEYSHLFHRIPAQYQMPQAAWCQNHDMHVFSDVWGQSCTLPPNVNYDAALMGGMRWNTPYCAGEKAIHQHIMENLEGWLVSTKGKRRFATYSFMDTHSPDHHSISFDERLANLVQNLLVGQDGRPPLLSPKSALVIMADHGLHYGRETYTFPGFIHHKIPPLFVALPNQLLNSRPEFVDALEQNQNRILSHLDLHQTFIHLAYGDFPVPSTSFGGNYGKFMGNFISDGTFRRQFHKDAPNETSYAQTYGRSLLLNIEEGRTCNTAGIPHDFCAFQPFLNLDPGKAVDATFLRGALVLMSNRMNNLTRIYSVDDICKASSTVLQPNIDMPSATGSFEDIGTEDLVMESAYASASVSRTSQKQGEGEAKKDETRIFYFMVRDRHQPTRKYSITMREDEAVLGKGDSMTIQQMSAYASAWRPCSRRISAGGRAVGRWSDVVKHFCEKDGTRCYAFGGLSVLRYGLLEDFRTFLELPETWYLVDSAKNPVLFLRPKTIMSASSKTLNLEAYHSAYQEIAKRITWTYYMAPWTEPELQKCRGSVERFNNVISVDFLKEL